MSTGLVLTALLMGLAGSPHCAAMCGAAVGGIGRTPQKLWAFQGGRLLGYAATRDSRAGSEPAVAGAPAALAGPLGAPGLARHPREGGTLAGRALAGARRPAVGAAAVRSALFGADGRVAECEPVAGRPRDAGVRRQLGRRLAPGPHAVAALAPGDDAKGRPLGRQARRLRRRLRRGLGAGAWAVDGIRSLVLRMNRHAPAATASFAETLRYSSVFGTTPRYASRTRVSL